MRAERGRWSNWGLFPETAGLVEYPANAGDVTSLLKGPHRWIPRGNGRCYGDASLAPHMISGAELRDVLELDATTGTLTCGAGWLLSEILEKVVPQGFFLPVTPGTKFISVGGAIAADVHGKNHHKEGNFSAFVERMTVVTGDGVVQECSPTLLPDLFHATCGGMGLTGMIVQATFRLKRVETAYIRQRSERCANLQVLLDRFERTMETTYSVAWIDLMAAGGAQGRSVLLLGEHATLKEISKGQQAAPLTVHRPGFLSVPFFFPSWVLGPWSVRIFNTLFYNKPSSKGERIVHYEPYFYPLDAIHHWNRIYGRRGFVQYQFVLPLTAGRDGLLEIIEVIRKEKLGSFLAVLKRFGPEDRNKPLNFPIEGYTLALDIARDERIFPILDRLDERVAAMNGRIYLAKDARMKSGLLSRTYPSLERFRTTARSVGKDRFASVQSDRLHLTSPSRMTTTFDKERVLVLGATSDIAQAIARAFVAKGHSITLAARDTRALSALSGELRARTKVDVVPFEATNMEAHAGFYASLDPKPGIVICAFGHLPQQAEAEENGAEAVRTLTINFTGAVSVLEEAARDLEQRGEGCIVGISSVAGDRGRASNYHYGSAKAGFSAYLSGLRNRLFKSHVHVVTVKPGFVRTRMTAGMPLPAPLTASPEKVASMIVNAVRTKRNTIYTLGRWRWVMWVIRSVPEPIFKRLRL